MTNAELLAKIKVEIDKLYGEYKDKFHQCGDQYHLGLIDGLDMAERVLDSLESEHLAGDRKTSQNDLEEAAWDCVLDSVDVNNPVLLPKYKVLLTSIFIDGAKWQKEHDAELIEIAYNDGITIGTTKQREMMMKEAVEGEVMLNPYPTICLDDCKDYDFKDGDKVRIIIVKE